MIESLFASAKAITRDTFTPAAFPQSTHQFVKRVIAYIRACLFSDKILDDICRLNECTTNVPCNALCIGISVSATVFTEERPNIGGLLSLIFDIIVKNVIPRMDGRGTLPCDTSMGSVLIDVTTVVRSLVPDDRRFIVITFGVHDDTTGTCTAISTSSYMLFRNRREAFRAPMCIVCCVRPMTVECYCSDECMLADDWLLDSFIN